MAGASWCCGDEDAALTWSMAARRAGAGRGTTAREAATGCTSRRTTWERRREAAPVAAEGAGGWRRLPGEMLAGRGKAAVRCLARRRKHAALGVTVVGGARRLQECALKMSGNAGLQPSGVVLSVKVRDASCRGVRRRHPVIVKAEDTISACFHRHYYSWRCTSRSCSVPCSLSPGVASITFLAGSVAEPWTGLGWGCPQTYTLEFCDMPRRAPTRSHSDDAFGQERPRSTYQPR